MKYVAIASGAINLALAVALFFMFSALNGTKVKLGKAEAVASANADVVKNARSMYRQCDAQRASVVADSNAVVERLVAAGRAQDAAGNAATMKATAAVARLEGAVSNIGRTPIGATCEARLANIAAQMEAYGKVALNAQ